MLAGRGHLIMFQQQLVASEQQMPRHPTAINPPTGREPAAPSLRHHHGDGHREHTDEVKVGRRRGEWSLHRRVSPSVSPRSRLFSSACPLRTRQDNQLGPSVCVCVCLLLTVMVGCDDSAVNLSV